MKHPLQFCVVPGFLMVLMGSCISKGPELSQSFCEDITDPVTCEAYGCTYNCGMVLVRGRECLGRRNAGICLAVIRWRGSPVNNLGGGGVISPGERVWICKQGIEHCPECDSCFPFENSKFPWGVEILGYDYMHGNDINFPTTDPCDHSDPDGTIYPWEGSCDSLRWTPRLWNDVLTKSR